MRNLAFLPRRTVIVRLTGQLLGTAVVLAIVGDYASAQTLPAPERFDRVLATYVREGLVDYAALRAHREDLDRYLDDLGRTSPTDLERASRDRRLAFWINAYNACALRLVVDHYPIAGGASDEDGPSPAVPLESIRQIPNAWTRQFCRVAQRKRSLDGIESGMLRPLGDPRIHFALSCASRSCCRLASHAYRGDRLDEQLDQAVRRFVADDRHFRLERGEFPVLWVNKFLDWYKEDFDGTSGVVLFLRRYASAADSSTLRPGKVRVEYLDFDWTLNDTAFVGATTR